MDVNVEYNNKYIICIHTYKYGHAELMKLYGLEFMRMIINPWLSDIASTEHQYSRAYLSYVLYQILIVIF